MVKVAIWNQAQNIKIFYGGTINIKRFIRAVSPLKTGSSFSNTLQVYLILTPAGLTHLLESERLPDAPSLSISRLPPTERSFTTAHSLACCWAPSAHSVSSKSRQWSLRTLILLHCLMGWLKLTVMKLFLWLFCFGQQKRRSCTFPVLISWCTVCASSH